MKCLILPYDSSSPVTTVVVVCFSFSLLQILHFRLSVSVPVPLPEFLCMAPCVYIDRDHIWKSHLLYIYGCTFALAIVFDVILFLESLAAFHFILL